MPGPLDYLYILIGRPAGNIEYKEAFAGAYFKLPASKMIHFPLLIVTAMPVPFYYFSPFRLRPAAYIHYFAACQIYDFIIPIVSAG